MLGTRARSPSLCSWVWFIHYFVQSNSIRAPIRCSDRRVSFRTLLTNCVGVTRRLRLSTQLCILHQKFLSNTKNDDCQRHAASSGYLQSKLFAFRRVRRFYDSVTISETISEYFAFPEFFPSGIICFCIRLNVPLTRCFSPDQGNQECNM